MRAAYDADAIIRDLHLDKAKASGDHIRCLCPFKHGDRYEEHRSFGINIFTGAWSCFSCNERGRKLEFLYTKLRVNPTRILTKMIEERHAKEVGDKSVLYAPYSKTYQKYIEFFQFRGVTLKTLMAFRVGYSENRSAYVFPVMWADGSKAGWIERPVVGDGHYFTCPEGAKKPRLPFGAHLIKKRSPVVIVEGPMDAMKVSQAGFPVIAMLGNRMNKEHARMLLDMSSKFIILPDNDEAGNRLLSDTIRNLNASSVKVARLPKTFKDAGESEVSSNIIVRALAHTHPL